MNTVSTKAALFEAAFHPYREPRSKAYRQGCLAALSFHFGEVEHIRCPYSPGTAKADAFYFGVQEGHAIARRARTCNTGT